MAGLPGKARVVVIGAGIVGNSMVWHLARLGWRDIMLLEKGTLPSPGPISTAHRVLVNSGSAPVAGGC